jgi:hypothetical protein
MVFLKSSFALAPIPQALGLPLPFRVTLGDVTPLTTTSGTLNWESNVRQKLRRFRSTTFLTTPHHLDYQFEQWNYWSQYVVQWLYHQIDISVQVERQG